MHEFIAKHQDKIAGTLSGFDRLVFRGSLRCIAYEEGMKGYLLGRVGFQQAVAILGKHGRVPDLVIRIQPDEPAKQQVVIHFFHQ